MLAVVVVAISDPVATRRVVSLVRQLNRAAAVIVRTRFVSEIEDLYALGADEVIPEEFETSLEMFSRVLRRYGIPANTIEREVQAARAELYGLVPSAEAGALQLDALAHLGVHHAIEMVEILPATRAVGEHPTTLHLRRETGATVIAVVRAGEAHYTPDPAFRFAPGDTVVLVGDDDALGKARALLTAPA